jgi:hypothetical protein
MAQVKLVTRRLRKCKIKGELWVDGSFLTEKIDPFMAVARAR